MRSFVETFSTRSCEIPPTLPGRFHESRTIISNLLRAMQPLIRVSHARMEEDVYSGGDARRMGPPKKGQQEQQSSVSTGLTVAICTEGVTLLIASRTCRPYVWPTTCRIFATWPV